LGTILISFSLSFCLSASLSLTLHFVFLSLSLSSLRSAASPSPHCCSRCSYATSGSRPSGRSTTSATSSVPKAQPTPKLKTPPEAAPAPPAGPRVKAGDGRGGSNPAPKLAVVGTSSSRRCGTHTMITHGRGPHGTRGPTATSGAGGWRTSCSCS